MLDKMRPITRAKSIMQRTDFRMYFMRLFHLFSYIYFPFCVLCRLVDHKLNHTLNLIPNLCQ